MLERAIISTLDGAQQYPLRDSDLLGLSSVIEHALQDGYLDKNKAWAEGILNWLRKLRGLEEEECEEKVKLGGE